MESAWNHGASHPSGRNDVIVYTRTGFQGSRACVQFGAKGNLSGGFVENVRSYRWVTRATCNAVPKALA